MEKPRTGKPVEPYDDTKFARQEEANRLRGEELRDPRFPFPTTLKEDEKEILTSTSSPKRLSDTSHRLLRRRAETSKPRLIKRLRSLESEEPDLGILELSALMQDLQQIVDDFENAANQYLEKVLQEAKDKNPNLSKEEEDFILFQSLQEWEGNLLNELQVIYQMRIEEGKESLEEPPVDLSFNQLTDLLKNDLIRRQKEDLKNEEEKEDSILNLQVDEETKQDKRKRVRFKARREVVKQYYERTTEFVKKLEKNYRSELYPNNRFHKDAPQWLLDLNVWDEWTMELFYGYLPKTIIPLTKEEKTFVINQFKALSEARKKNKMAKLEGELLEMRIEGIDWKKMQRKFKKSVQQLRAIISHFVYVTALKPLPQKLKHGKICHSMGYWGAFCMKGEWVTKPILYFRKDSMIIKRLKEGGWRWKKM